MAGVIIEYKGQNRIRIIPSAQELRKAEKFKRIQRKRKPLTNLGAIQKSENREVIPTSVKMWDWDYNLYDTKTWKNQKHAHKNWMRHIHRWQPSARTIADNCIYPNTTEGL